jgi:hypothetical protein
MHPVILSPLQAEAPGRSYLCDLLYRPSKSLSLTVAGVSDVIDGRRFEYRFHSLRAFLLVDEGDLIAIWESQHYVPDASVLYEVVQGSIYEVFSQRPGIFSVSMPHEALDELHEYLLATDHDCVLVLASQPPVITELHQDA